MSSGVTRKLVRNVLMLGIPLCLVFACYSRSNGHVVDSVLVDVISGNQNPNLVIDRKFIRESILESLSSSDFLEWKPSSEKRSPLRVQIYPMRFLSDQEMQSAPPFNKWVVSATLREKEKSNAIAVKVDLEINGQEEVAANLGNAIRKLVFQVSSIMELEGQETPKLLTKLEKCGAKDKAIKERCFTLLQALGARKDKNAVLNIAKLLFLEDSQISDMALSTLAQIGDPSAVELITRYAERKPSRMRRNAIRAVGLIGGQDAAEWLFTLSTGHLDPLVREEASFALSQVEQRFASMPKPKSPGVNYVE